MTIDDIDFNALYKQHLIACNHYHLPPDKWDKKHPKWLKIWWVSQVAIMRS